MRLVCAVRHLAGWHTLLIALLGLTLGGLYFGSIDLRDPAYSYGVHERIMGGDAGSPYRYRVLVPILLEALTRAFTSVEPRDLAFLHASAVYVCVGLVSQLLALYALARQWFSSTQSLIGVAFTSGITLATFAYFSYQPWSILEVTLVAVGFLFAYRGQWALVGVVVLLASLNRETGVFLPLALLLGSLECRHPFDVTAIRTSAARRETQWAFAFVIMSTSVFAALRLLRGSADQADVGFVLTRNLQPEHLSAAGIAVPLFLGLGWIFALRGVPLAPAFIRGVGRVLPFYLAAFIVWGWWRETRILTTVYPIVIPLILAYCYPPRSASRSNEE